MPSNYSFINRDMANHIKLVSVQTQLIIFNNPNFWNIILNVSNNVMFITLLCIYAWRSHYKIREFEGR